MAQNCDKVLIVNILKCSRQYFEGTYKIIQIDTGQISYTLENIKSFNLIIHSIAILLVLFSAFLVHNYCKTNIKPQSQSILLTNQYFNFCN